MKIQKWKGKFRKEKKKQTKKNSPKTKNLGRWGEMRAKAEMEGLALKRKKENFFYET